MLTLQTPLVNIKFFLYFCHIKHHNYHIRHFVVVKLLTISLRLGKIVTIHVPVNYPSTIETIMSLNEYITIKHVI